MRELKNVALKGCDEEVRAFAACAEGKLLSVIWHCRALSKAVDQCLDRYSKDEVLKDEMRREYVQRSCDAPGVYASSAHVFLTLHCRREIAHTS